MAKQEQAIEAELKETQEEIADFQLEKLKKTNELFMAVVLDIEKVQNLVSVDNDNRVRIFCHQRLQKYQEL